MMIKDIFYCGHCGGLANPKSEKCEFCGAYFVEEKEATNEEVKEIQNNWGGTKLDPEQLKHDIEESKKLIDSYGDGKASITFPAEICDKEEKKKEKIKYIQDVRGSKIEIIEPKKKKVWVDPGKEPASTVVTEEKDGVIYVPRLYVKPETVITAFNMDDEPLHPGDMVSPGSGPWCTVKKWTPSESTLPVGVVYREELAGKDYGMVAIDGTIFSEDEKLKFRLEIIKDKLKWVLGKYASHATIHNYREMRHEIVRLMEDYDYVPRCLDINTRIEDNECVFILKDFNNKLEIRLPVVEKTQCPYPGGRVGTITKNVVVPSRPVVEDGITTSQKLVIVAVISWIIFAIIMKVLYG